MNNQIAALCERIVARLENERIDTLGQDDGSHITIITNYIIRNAIKIVRDECAKAMGDANTFVSYPHNSITTAIVENERVKEVNKICDEFKEMVSERNKLATTFKQKRRIDHVTTDYQISRRLYAAAAKKEPAND